MTLIFQALAMLCAFGSVSLAASTSTWVSRLCLAIGFVLSAVLVRPERMPDTVTIAIAAACAAWLGIARPRNGFVWFFSAIGGFLSGVFSVLVETMGAGRWSAIGMGAGLLLVPAYLAAVAREFAPERVREEALILVLVLALTVAAAPSILAGWTSALSLNMGAAVMNKAAAAERSFPVWVMLTGATSIALGGLYSLWRRN